MALRDFLYPHLEVQLVLARSLEADEAHVGRGSLSKEYQEVAARIRIAERDAQRLQIKEGDHVEVSSKIGSVVVVAELSEVQPEGLVVMPPGPWAFAVIETMLPSQGTKVKIKANKEALTSIDSLP
ncbi:MAG: molybdopterin dinucleotide binding domain-containing protein [Candidatus Thorarchaeota archaeon]